MDAGFYLAMAPWLAFVVADRSAGLGPSSAAVVAAAVAAGVLATDIRRRRRRLLPGFGVGFFGSLAVVVAASGEQPWMARYDRALVVAVLAVVLLAAATRGGQQQGRTALRWAVAAVAVAGSFVVAGMSGGPLAATVFNWLAPIVVVIAAAASPRRRPVARDEVTTALLTLEGLIGHPAGGSLDTQTAPQLRLMPAPPGRDDH